MKSVHFRYEKGKNNVYHAKFYKIRFFTIPKKFWHRLLSFRCLHMCVRTFECMIKTMINTISLPFLFPQLQHGFLNTCVQEISNLLNKMPELKINNKIWMKLNTKISSESLWNIKNILLEVKLIIVYRFGTTCAWNIIMMNIQRFGVILVNFLREFFCYESLLRSMT